MTTLPPPAVRFANRRDPIRLLILGGSRGARVINQCLPVALACLPKEQRPDIWHQTGAAHVEETTALYHEQAITGRIEPFIEEMAVAYAWADLVVCRAGALTIAELTAIGLGSILIPFPFAIKDHQTQNALWLAESGGAILLSQSLLTAKRLAEILQSLSVNRPQLLKMAEAAHQLAMPKALDKIVSHCIEVSHAKFSTN